MIRTPSPTLFSLVMWVLAAPAYGQWVEQTFELKEGWNSIFLEVDPAPATADELFAGQSFASVWTRTPRPVSQLGDDCGGPNDPDCLGTVDTQWRVWLPPGPAAGPVKNLRVIRGGRVYFIEANVATKLTVVGRPNGAETRYFGGFNAVGFYVSPGAAPTFDAYLAPSPSLSKSTIYVVQPNGEVVPVDRGSPITPRRGYWVSAPHGLTYSGPVEIDRLSLRNVDYGVRATQQQVGIKNFAGAQTDLSLVYLPSAAVPVTNPPQPHNAGKPPLYWLDYGSGSKAEDMFQWRRLRILSLEGPSTSLQIGVRRTGLAPASVDRDFQGSQYQGVLRVRNATGFQRYLGVTAEVISSFSSRGPSASRGPSTGPSAGLYLGRIKVDHVAWVTAGARIWTNDSPDDPEFAAIMRCDGGTDDGAACFPDRNRCVGTPEIELTAIFCRDDVDCPSDGQCVTITDCLGGTCSGFCIGGPTPDDPCTQAADCADDGVCSADVDTTALRPVAFPFEFSVLFHLSEFGEVKMLTDVSILANDDNAIVLATPDCDPELCDSLHGALTVNGQPQAYRISTPAFSFEHDLLLSGSFTDTLTGATTIEADDPLNPFRHKFHPDGDCDLPGECFEVTRAFVFQFEPNPPPGISNLTWGDATLGGVYTEQVSGLHRETITARGRFEINRVSLVGLLNTPVGGQQP